MKLNDEIIEEMSKKYGEEKMLKFADVMLEMMVASGDKKAIIYKTKEDVIDLINKNIIEKNTFI